MRESLFRAAQICNFSILEETVGQKQSYDVTESCYHKSKFKVTLNEEDDFKNEKSKMIIWPYPQNTADCIDRANCIDYFINKYPNYRVVTEFSLKKAGFKFLEPDDNLIIFASFEYLLNDIDRGEDGYLYYRGRKCHAIVNELIIGYLLRKGLVNKKEVEKISDIINTKIINSTSIALDKSKQMKLIKNITTKNDILQIKPMDYIMAKNESELRSVINKFLDNDKNVVIRPFSSSQGTGLSFVMYSKYLNQREKSIEKALNSTIISYQKKYNSSDCYPLTVTPFYESIKYQGCVTDFRIFVIYDPFDHCLHSIPAMMRRAQVPLENGIDLTISNGVTNLNAPKAENALPGERVFAITNKDLLVQLNIKLEIIENMCNMASLIWGNALESEMSEGRKINFAYGSVDFIITKEMEIVPIEMNGANVGSHPAVHPKFLSAFGKSVTHALEKAGLNYDL